MDEQERQRLLRKHKDTLYISGTGIMVLGIWTVLQFFIYVTMMNREIDDIAKSASDVGADFVYIILLAMTLIEVIMRLYIGICARSVAVRDKRHIMYVILAVFVVIAYLGMIVLAFMDISNYSVVRFTATMIVQLTAILVNLQLIYAGIKVRRL